MKKKNRLKTKFPTEQEIIEAQFKLGREGLATALRTVSKTHHKLYAALRSAIDYANVLESAVFHQKNGLPKSNPVHTLNRR